MNVKDKKLLKSVTALAIYNSLIPKIEKGSFPSQVLFLLEILNEQTQGTIDSSIKNVRIINMDQIQTGLNDNEWNVQKGQLVENFDNISSLLLLNTSLNKYNAMAVLKLKHNTMNVRAYIYMQCRKCGQTTTLELHENEIKMRPWIVTIGFNQIQRIDAMVIDETIFFFKHCKCLQKNKQSQTWQNRVKTFLLNFYFSRKYFVSTNRCSDQDQHLDLTIFLIKIITFSCIH